MQINEAVTNFLEAKQDLSPRTLTQYQDSLEVLKSKVTGEMPGTPEQIEKALNTANTIWVKAYWYRGIKVFYRWCARRYDIINPLIKVDPPKVPEVDMKALEPAELTRVLFAAGSTLEKAVVTLALDCGVRASEFGRIKICDIYPDTILINGKGNRQLRVPISPETLYILNSLAETIPERGNKSLLFIDRLGKPVDRFGIYKIVRGCMDRAGIAGPKRGPHCLRHSLGKNYIEAGGDVMSLKRVMRHKSIAMTQKYVNLSMTKVCEFHNKFSPVRGALLGSQGVLIK